jgi:hypothetical protein
MSKRYRLCFTIADEKFLCLPDASVVLCVFCSLGKTACYHRINMDLNPSSILEQVI